MGDKLMVQAVFERDYPVIHGNIVIVATLHLVRQPDPPILTSAWGRTQRSEWTARGQTVGA